MTRRLTLRGPVRILKDDEPVLESEVDVTIDCAGLTFDLEPEHQPSFTGAIQEQRFADDWRTAQQSAIAVKGDRGHTRPLAICDQYSEAGARTQELVRLSTSGSPRADGVLLSLKTRMQGGDDGAPRKVWLVYGRGTVTEGGGAMLRGVGMSLASAVSTAVVACFQAIGDAITSALAVKGRKVEGERQPVAAAIEARDRDVQTVVKIHRRRGGGTEIGPTEGNVGARLDELER